MSLIDRLPERFRRHEVLGQFVRFALVGCLNVASFFTIVFVSDWIGVPFRLATAIAYVLTSILSFVLNKRWSFRDGRRERVVRQYLRFLTFTLIGLGLYQAALHLTLVPLARYGKIGRYAAALCAIPVSVVWNFTSYRLWTFHAPRRVSAEV